MLTPAIIRRAATALGLAVLAACLLACGSVRQAAERQKKSNDLKQIGLALHSYNDVKKTLPPDEKDFLDWARQFQPEIVPLVQSGQYTIIYAKVSLGTLPDGASNTVLGYENVPSTPGGRLVLTADAAVFPMSEAEFQNKPRVGAAKKK
jgi:hypothetical protein